MKTNFKLTEKARGVLSGLIGVIVITVFAYSIVSIFQENSNKEIAALEDMQRKDVAKEIAANIKRDSAIAISTKLSYKVGLIENQLQETHNTLLKMHNTYQKNLNELKLLQNEKLFVPDNATSSEQSDFLTKYKYTPY